jgi:hypothetical protein
MSRNPNERLARLHRRAEKLAERVNPPPGCIVVWPPDADHPHGTRVRRSLCLTVYHDPAMGKPTFPEAGPYTRVILCNGEEPDEGSWPPPFLWDVGDDAADPDG